MSSENLKDRVEELTEDGKDIWGLYPDCIKNVWIFFDNIY